MSSRVDRVFHGLHNLQHRADCMAFVLAGGKSRRMGRDKALLPLGSSTLIDHVAREAEIAAGRVMIVGRTELPGKIPYASIGDDTPGEGPLAAIATALRESPAAWNLIVACDMPNVNAELMGMLLDESMRHSSPATIPVSPDGRAHPLCAVYHQAVLPTFEAALARGERRLLQAVADLQPNWLHLPDGRRMLNLNTIEDWNSFKADGFF